ncbi:MAG: DUF655 domain-containing protein, partial [Firmicutes bacterium]|nr:DUF655 domain-containing protein [Bacillota bacterium]
MTLEWFKNPDHVVYVEKEKFVDNFAKETGIPNLRKEIDHVKRRVGYDELTSTASKELEFVIKDIVMA